MEGMVSQKGLYSGIELLEPQDYLMVSEFVDFLLSKRGYAGYLTVVNFLMNATNQHLEELRDQLLDNGSPVFNSVIEQLNKILMKRTNK
ncbi:hypothetical protein ABER99_20300 [Paenibacillus glucanolyticus]|jgi:hypothetical protein|uniref:Uncharacterized protein n=1 Tax=Paenibacillus glucanolyticus TaxID=59843 RepID=A0A163GJP5_9BACL|nr:hypothetical protein [Paenibacillus glucanolyticus]KZS45008.1 hypothetical protein AWU65_03235 [Paenibacillus glucanolyticus]OMF64136.1 hypothetical protein BK142_32100 [Paenibacillus glucanolyticus]